LPAAVHDAAAAAVGRFAYLLGGGDLGSSDAIVRVSRTGAARAVARLPIGASDVSAAVLEGTIYVVGGYTGSRPLDTIVAWRPGSPARVAGHLPFPVRYAAVAPAGGAVIVAGGTVGTSASRAILRFDPGRRTVRRIGTLPRPLTHAAATTLRGRVLVAGGRGSELGTQVRSLLAIDPATGRVAAAGALPRGLSDMGGAGALLAGGRDRRGRVSDEVWELRAR
jgi:hypothetical protein